MGNLSQESSIDLIVNSSENYTAPYTGIDSFALCVGICYTITGVVFIFLQLTCAYLILVHQEMKNPTYMLVVNLSITDAVELLAISLYSGISIIIDFEYSILQKAMGWVSLTAWYANCFLFVYIAFSRWIAIAKPEYGDVIFTKKIMTILHLSSLIPAAMVTFYFTTIHDPPVATFFRSVFTWGFNMETRMGKIWHWINFGINTVTCSTEMTLNALSFLHIYKIRKQVQSVAVAAGQRKEIKLLVQCAVLGCVFSVGCVVIFHMTYLSGWTGRGAFLFIQSVWMFNHCVNPIVYLSVNRELRKSFIRFITGGKLGSHSTAVQTTNF